MEDSAEAGRPLSGREMEDIIIKEPPASGRMRWWRNHSLTYLQMWRFKHNIRLIESEVSD